MADLTNLPNDISPADFFQIVEETLADTPAPDNASPDKGQVTLTGDGGGTWTMGFVDGRVKIESGTTDEPPVHVTLSVADWRDFIAGRVRDAVKEHVDQAALDPAAMSKLFQNADKVEQLKALKGDLQVVVEDGGGEMRLTLTTGGVAPNIAEPTCKVISTLDDFALLAAGKENPQAAFFGGKIRIEGDMNHVMQMFAMMAM